MAWIKGISYGLGLWVIIFLVTSLLRGFGLYGQFGVRLGLAVFMGWLAYAGCHILKPTKVKFAVAYGAIWVGLFILLDSVIAVQFNNDLFRSEFQWFGYLVMLILPIFRVDKSSSKTISSLGV